MELSTIIGKSIIKLIRKFSVLTVDKEQSEHRARI